MKKPHQKAISQTPFAEYGGLIGGIAELLGAARRTAARTINALMTATYWRSAGASWNSNKKVRHAPAMENKFFPSFLMI
jgi:hypothetical protein